MKFNMDAILCISEDIHHLVQQHLNGSDVKAAFQVSQTWFAYFVNSPSAMQKIILNVNAIPPKEIETILSSPRYYASLVFNCSRNIQILTEFAASLINLKITQMQTAVEDDSVCFSRLQVLEIGKNIDPVLVDTLFVLLQTQLQSLVLGTTYISDGIAAYLKSHQLLKELSFLEPREIFSQDISFLCDLQLRKLKLGRIFSKDLENENYMQNVLQLVKSQAASIKYFGMNSDNAAILQLVLGMKLMCLHIHVYSWFPFEMLPINTSIECAKLDSNYCLTPDYNTFLAKLPNMTKLYHDTMTGEKLKGVVGTAKKLEEILYTESHWDGEITEFYDGMKNSEDPNVNRSIQLKKIESDFEFKV